MMETKYNNIDMNGKKYVKELHPSVIHLSF